ncbi:DUF305 domain-containing protein [Campylobacter sp. MIT 99-7217]|nr:DUF305 domain-containing protein [Campylobacter sp. MIT 99-7217]
MNTCQSKACQNSAKVLFSMHEAMMKTPNLASKNAERDFLSNMIPHHQGAIDSSKIMLELSKNKKIHQIAQNIIKAQEQEIKEFQALLASKNAYSKPMNDKKYQEFKADEAKIMQDMMKSMQEVKPSEELDKDFLRAMIHHHAGAIEASKQILKYSNDKKIQDIAQNIIKVQEQEIKEFNELLNKGF